MTGGMICPPVDEAASMAAAFGGEKPSRRIIGMVKTPWLTTLATALPDASPMNSEDTVAIFPEPPREAPHKAFERSSMNSMAPVRFKIAP